jgi:hypothetical protein
LAFSILHSLPNTLQYTQQANKLSKRKSIIESASNDYASKGKTASSSYIISYSRCVEMDACAL